MPRGNRTRALHQARHASYHWATKRLLTGEEPETRKAIALAVPATPLSAGDREDAGANSCYRRATRGRPTDLGWRYEGEGAPATLTLLQTRLQGTLMPQASTPLLATPERSEERRVGKEC